MPNYFPLIGVVIGLLACCAFIYLGMIASNGWFKCVLFIIGLGFGILSFSELDSAISSAGASVSRVQESNTSLRVQRP